MLVNLTFKNHPKSGHPKSGCFKIKKPLQADKLAKVG